MDLPNKPLILFDGICNLCNNSVQFIISNDKKEVFVFTSLQSEIGQKILINSNLNPHTYTSILLFYQDEIYTKSTAILMIAKILGGKFKFFAIIGLIPKFLRDYLYTLISKNRYSLFGKNDFCMIPTSELKDRFI
jgi:predicted DCC family thiol-disulfide oxidoreductase YuxK